MRISDWSSDVCSSDLEARYAVVLNHEVGKQAAIRVGAHAVEGSFGNRRRKAIRFFALYININQFVGDRQRGPIEVMYPAVAQPSGVADRAEERRVWTECVSTCRVRGWQYH